MLQVYKLIPYNKSGRDNKNSYKSVFIRVPELLVGKIDLMVEAYRQAVNQRSYEGIENANLLCKSDSQSPLLKDQALAKAKAIFQKKRSKKERFTKLLQVLLDKSITENVY